MPRISYTSHLSDKVVEAIKKELAGEEPWDVVSAVELALARLRDEHGIEVSNDEEDEE